MKVLRITAFLLGLSIIGCITAQRTDSKANNKGTAGEAAEEHVVTDECRVNLSLFTEYAKVKNYADAYGPWKMVYETCPTASKNIYIRGVNILKWKMRQVSTPEEKTEVFNQLMKLYDDRIKYYGNDRKKPRVAILADKSDDFLKYRPNDMSTVYPWLKEAIVGLKEKADASDLQNFILVSSTLYKEDNTLAEQFIGDYTIASGIISQNCKDTLNLSEKEINNYKMVKQEVDERFAASGVADCEKMNEVFLPNVENNKENLDYLKSVMSLFKQVKCFENEAYFKAAEYSHKISPSAEAATGLGNMCYVKGEYNDAIKYYSESIDLSTEDIDKADNLFRIAQCYFKKEQYSQTKNYCKQSLSKNPDQGQPHILLGVIYASAKIYDDPVLQKSVFWAAVDQFKKAKAVDSSEDMAEQANKLIRTYSAYFPSKEDIFMHPDMDEGKSFYVGGWINETTTARSK